MAGSVSLRRGDCLSVMADLPADSFDAIVTDPPYHLASIVRRFGGQGAAEAQHGTDGLYQRASRGFMGQQWDGGDIAFRPETWAACLRVLKPGGHLIAFNHSRTYHHMALAIEAAGFEARDSILSIADTGPAWADFLDSLTDAQIDGLGRALAATDGGMLAWLYGSGFPKSHDVAKGIDKALGAEREVLSEHKTGWSGTLGGKAALHGLGGAEDVRRSTAPATPEAAEWEGWGTALKPAMEPIIAARKPITSGSVARQHMATGTGGLNIDAARVETAERLNGGAYSGGNKRREDASSYYTGVNAGVFRQPKGRWPANVVTDGAAATLSRFPQDADGSVARFFYSAKADADDRAGSDHPTVKPQSLMRWLVRMVTAKGGHVLDPFAGSGATGWAAWREGRVATLIEREDQYADHIADRIARLGQPPEPKTEDERAEQWAFDL